MRVEVKLFAVARQMAGRDTIELQLPEGAKIGEVRAALVAAIPELDRLAAHLLFAVNSEYAADGTVVLPGADVACIPPVSGG